MKNPVLMVSQNDQLVTLRDLFAAAALTGLLAMYAHPQYAGEPPLERSATSAYEYADAMLREREK